MTKITTLEKGTNKIIDQTLLIKAKQKFGNWHHIIKPESILIKTSLIEFGGVAPFFLITKSKTLKSRTMNFHFDVYYGVFMVDEGENELLFDATELYTCYNFYDITGYVIDRCGYKSLTHIMESIYITVNKSYVPGEERGGFPVNGFCNKH